MVNFNILTAPRFESACERRSRRQQPERGGVALIFLLHPTIFSAGMMEIMQTNNEGRVSAPSFRYNHAKNYFGVAIAVAAPGSTGALVQAYIVRGAGAAKCGAQELGLLTDDGHLTTRGDEAAVLARETYGSLEAALERFEELKGTTERFCEIDDGVWGDIASSVALEHPVVSDLVDLIDDAGGELRLPELAHAYLNADYQRATTVMLRDSAPLADGSSETADALYDPGVYRTAITCQLKTILYHCGVVTETGSDSQHLIPETDVWELDCAADPHGGGQRC